MAIAFVSGKPRSGKTYWSFVKLLVNEVRTTERYVVTNIAVDLEELAATLQEDYGTDFDLRHRVRLLTEQETFRFWRYYGPGLEVDKMRQVYIDEDPLLSKWYQEHNIPLPKNKTVGLVVPDFECRKEAKVVYFIDEVHVYFNARRWQNTGDECLYVASQHAKMGDDWLLISQAITQCDAQLRNPGLVQEYHYLRNHSKEKSFFGLFKAPSYFSRRMYLKPYTGAPGEKCEELRFYSLDPRYAKCYKTQAGVGLVGKLADMGADKRRAIPAWGIPVALLAAGMLALQIPSAFGWVAGKFLGTAEAATKKAAGIPTNTVAAAVPSPGAVVQRLVERPPAFEPPKPKPAQPPKPRLTGIMRWGTKITAYLSDGTVWTPQSGLQSIGPGWAKINGEIYRYAAGAPLFAHESGRE